MKPETKNKPRILDLFFLYYNNKKIKQYKKENEENKDHPIVFFGDSITDRCDLKKFYPDMNIYNRGISGNTVNDLIERINESVFDLHPSKIVLLIGINNLMNLHMSSKDTAKCYENLLKKLRNKYSDLPIYCQSVYPGYDAPKSKVNHGLIFPLASFSKDIIELNHYIQQLCKQYNCEYIDVHSHLVDENNLLITSYSFDGCHPNDKGYEVISKIVSSIVKAG